MEKILVQYYPCEATSSDAWISSAMKRLRQAGPVQARVEVRTTWAAGPDPAAEPQVTREWHYKGFWTAFSSKLEGDLKQSRWGAVEIRLMKD
jgi:hypothetical protein